MPNSKLYVSNILPLNRKLSNKINIYKKKEKEKKSIISLYIVSEKKSVIYCLPTMRQESTVPCEPLLVTHRIIWLVYFLPISWRMRCIFIGWPTSINRNKELKMDIVSTILFCNCGAWSISGFFFMNISTWHIFCLPKGKYVTMFFSLCNMHF